MKYMKGKHCSFCKDFKPLHQFPPDKRSRDGKQARCRACTNEWMKLHYRKDPVWSMLRRAKARAKKEGFEFDLTVDDISPLPDKCPVLGLQLRLSEFSQDPCAYSLDRIDNKQGYIRGNVAVMSYRANRLKNDGTAEDHEAIAAWMRKQHVLAANDNDTAITRAADRIMVVV